MRTTLKVGTKGRVRLPKPVLDQLGGRPGDRLTVEVLAPGRLELRLTERTGSIDDFIGCMARPGGPMLSLEEIEQAIQDGWAGRK